MIDLNKEMAWITFLGPDWEMIWYPVTDVTGEQLEWGIDGTEIMDHCRAQFNYFGIAPTSQMLMKNSTRDNL